MDLGMNVGALRREVGRYLGFDRDPANWGTNETQDVWDIIDSGLRQFYRPPRLEGEVISYQWSFLKPFFSINLVPDQEDYDMPSDFAGLDGSLYYQFNDYSTSTIQIVNEAFILGLRQSTWYETTQETPKYAAFTPLQVNGIQQQVQRMLVWPKPDAAYTIKGKYYVRQRTLRDDTEIPSGGPDHAETIKCSCLAAAEAHLNDEAGGPQYQLFIRQLQSSVDFDRRATSPMNVGYNRDRESFNDQDQGYIRSTRLTRYDKFPE